MSSSSVQRLLKKIYITCTAYCQSIFVLTKSAVKKCCFHLFATSPKVNISHMKKVSCKYKETDRNFQEFANVFERLELLDKAIESFTHKFFTLCRL